MKPYLDFSHRGDAEAYLWLLIRVGYGSDRIEVHLGKQQASSAKELQEKYALRRKLIVSNFADQSNGKPAKGVIRIYLLKCNTPETSKAPEKMSSHHWLFHRALIHQMALDILATEN